MFLSAIDMYGHRVCHDSLQKLILSETSIFDVLHSFFHHPNIQVRQAALEVYVRRSYIAYELNSIQHFSLSTNDCLVEFQLQLPSTHPNKILLNNSVQAISRVSSLSQMNNSEIMANQQELGRVGIMAAYDDWEKAMQSFDELLAHYGNNQNDSGMFTRYSSYSPTLMTKSNHASPEKQGSPEPEDSNTSANGQIKNIPPVGIQKLQQFESIASNMSSHARKASISSIKEFSPSVVYSESDSINILNIFVRDFPNLTDLEDETLAELFYKFAISKIDQLNAKRIRRLTFCSVRKRSQPSYFTFRARDNFDEDKIYRHLEPALAFQLEIYRLRSFHLELIPTSNLKIHLYLGNIFK